MNLKFSKGGRATPSLLLLLFYQEMSVNSLDPTLPLTLTTTSEEIGEHIEWVGVLPASSFMSFQTFLYTESGVSAMRVTNNPTYLAMSIVYLAFLRLISIDHAAE